MYSAGKPPHSRAATSTVQQLLLFSPSVCVCACVSHEHHLPLHHSEPRRLVKALGGELGRGCEVGRSSCSPCLQVVLFCPLSAHGSPERRLMTCSPSGDKQLIVVHVMTKLQLRRNGRPVMCTVCLSWMQQALFPHSLVWCVVMGTSEPPFASHMKLCKTLTYFYIQGRSVLLLLLFQWLMFTLNASAVSNNEASACAVNLRLLLKLRLISFFPTVGAAWCHNRIAVMWSFWAQKPLPPAVEKSW